MADQIQYAVTLAIHTGKLDEFKALAAEAIALVEANEPNMLGYNWYLDSSQNSCTLIEQFRGPDDILTHLGNVGEVLGKLLEVSDISIDVYGETTADVRTALDPLGAVYNDHLSGFSRY